MKVAFVIYDGMTALDFVGIYDPITRLKTMGFVPDLEWQICAPSEEVQDGAGLRFVPTRVGEPLEDYDVVIVPGGVSARTLIDDVKFVDWIRTAGSSTLKVSVCTGALLLGAAGFLRGKRATTHPKALGDLQRFCRSVVKERIVDEGDVITAGGVAASIDLGLYLCERMVGREAREQIRQRLDYPSAD
jgi:transcriptional regulator GlxA family with amidase domain